MSLATRCTACGTIFRVVQDQLRVSDGWVRCGCCEAVFHAQSSVFDLQRDLPPAWQPVPASVVAAAAAAEPQTDAPPAPSEPMAEASPPAADAADVRGDSDSDSDGSDGPAAPVDTDWPRSPWSAGSVAPDTDADARRDAGNDSDASPPTPSFLRQAERRERWQQRPVRGLLGAVVALAALGLLLQATHQFRHRWAAQYPAAVPWLRGYCAIAQCRIDSLRRIDEVSIENTALTQGRQQDGASATDDGSDAALDNDARVLRLSLTLRNRGAWTIAMPSVDVSLTYSDGELVSRRALSPLDFGVPDARLLPGQDTPLSLRFSVAGERVSGYTVEVFYP